jgi:hypothetical protein
MPTTATRNLAGLAALIWYVGAIALLLKARSLLAEAAALQPHRIWPWIAMTTALALGGLKARFIFSRSCRKNLDRISKLEQPRPWQFFGGGFMLLLATMIAAGVTLSRLAHGNYAFLIAVATLDLSISVALLGSSAVFWSNGAFRKHPRQ